MHKGFCRVIRSGLGHSPYQSRTGTTFARGKPASLPLRGCHATAPHPGLPQLVGQPTNWWVHQALVLDVWVIEVGWCAARQDVSVQGAVGSRHSRLKLAWPAGPGRTPPVELHTPATIRTPRTSHTGGQSQCLDAFDSRAVRSAPIPPDRGHQLGTAGRPCLVRGPHYLPEDSTTRPRSCSAPPHDLAATGCRKSPGPGPAADHDTANQQPPTPRN